MPRAFNSLSSRNKFAKRHYEAIATAIQEARRRANGSNNPSLLWSMSLRTCSPVITACSSVIVSCAPVNQEQTSEQGAKDTWHTLSKVPQRCSS